MTDSQDAWQAVVLPDGRLWGKEHGLAGPYPVMCHLLDVAATFGVLWDELLEQRVRERFAGQLGLSESECRAVLSFWAGLHDLGKISPAFQAQVPALFEVVGGQPEYAHVAGARMRHEMATHWSLGSLLEEAGYPNRHGAAQRGGSGAQLAHWVGQLLGGHHGLFGRKLTTSEMRTPASYEPGLGAAGWHVQRRCHLEELRRVTGAASVPAGALSADLAVVLSGLVVCADWLASDTAAIESVRGTTGWQGTAAEVDAHFARAVAAAPALVGAARLGRAEFAESSFGGMFPFAPNPLQADLVAQLPGLVQAHGPGVLLVTAPTGDGKTEAALFASSVLGRAAGARGMFVALPTMATADAMYGRVRAFAESALTGQRALTLLHSMAWLNSAYTPPSSDDRTAQLSSDTATSVAAGDWVRGNRRGFLAPLSVGTVDQVLAGVLPLRYNTLRLFGLHEKVFVVDEAHAYGPWMHKLLLVLLEWLGAMRAPVVLLSATLTGQAAASLVNAYRRGAGFTEAAPVEPAYPGWVYAGAVTGEVSAPRSTATGRPRTLDVVVRPVAWDVREGEAGGPAPAGGRRAAVREELRQVVEGGGTALVCCTTVAEAQATFRDIRAAFPELAGRPGGVRLLHSRFPARVRQEIAAECERAYGKPEAGAEPSVREPSVLVATQVVEQSLDLDFEVVISDLAPLAQLLQRAGRCRRHQRGGTGRPAWAAAEDAPRVVVLDPFLAPEGRMCPRSWGLVYDASLLLRTSLLLRERAGEGIAVPGGVQELVDAVYAPDFVDDLDAGVGRELRDLDLERLASQAAETSLADMVAIGGPGDVQGYLHLLSRRVEGVDEDLLTTRLGADTGRVVCVYAQPDGAWMLDESGEAGLPEGPRPSRRELAEVMARVVPVPGRWLRDGGVEHPPGWRQQPLLREVGVLVLTPGEEGEGWRCGLGERTIALSEVGVEEL
ncbi:CRISPR-associated endonuclease Cas3'' [Streptomyces physcomitrii]|uniref:CRISPR-associated endonuclease Cas3 n=1 Tax=Streptomyces physcomitrii TaxID=2724184 RepID=A0ABX1H1D6_9ACTN|nr:CRISPR-associated endonuclease Cas3'' [Streptomyces physcomitrii]NKI41099.1 CRISPR-associated endonuclease Cas3'' [Streptomyces physcomitrii]